MIGLGVERLNKEFGKKPKRSRHCNSEQICNYVIGVKSEKAQISEDLKPGELPNQQSPFDLRVTGRRFFFNACFFVL